MITRSYLILFLFCIAIDVSASCTINKPPPSLTLDYTKYRDFEVRSPTPFSIDPVVTELKWQGQHWQAGHYYFAFDFPRAFPDEPITNGHVHTLQVGHADKQAIDNASTLHWSLLPTIAVSSNQLKHPDKLDTESFRLDGHVIWERTLRRNWAFFAGVCLDALTGNYEAIPAIGVQHQSPQWNLTLAYPQSQLQYTLTSTIKPYAQWSLSGNEWSVLDGDLTIRSDFQYEAQRVKLGIRMGNINLSWRYLFNQEIQYLARNSSNLTAELENTSGLSLNYSHLF